LRPGSSRPKKVFEEMDSDSNVPRISRNTQTPK
jgi:hypothetical protein